MTGTQIASFVDDSWQRKATKDHYLFIYSSHFRPMGRSVAILPVVTKDLPSSPRFTPYELFFAMQVQHSYNSSTNG